MARTETCEAITLKTYDIGEADRLCIFLTDTHGRIAVSAKGIRKLTSRWGSSVQSFQHLTLDLAEHSSGYYLRSATCIASFPTLRCDLQKFSVASRGAELLLHFLHDTEPSDQIFSLSREYFEQCDAELHELTLPTFKIMLLKELGLLPAYEKDGTQLSSYINSTARFSERLGMELSTGEQKKLMQLCDEYLRDHLSFPLKSARTPIFSD